MGRTDRARIESAGDKPANGTLRTNAINWQLRYGRSYKKQCAIAHKIHYKGKSLCCCCLVTPAKEMHHSSYGKNLIGVNWWPVCRECHENICHHPRNWLKDNKNPVWGNRNTESFTERLRVGFQILHNGVY